MKIQNPFVPVAFLTGGFFSGLCGFLGMKTATLASSRTANGARTSLDQGLRTAFRSGAVMGMSVVGLGLIGLGLLYLAYAVFFHVQPGPEVGALYQQQQEVVTTVIAGFAMGASSIALFARVGGGIYTKAADVGADLVGKVEAGIPEDDPPQPRHHR